MKYLLLITLLISGCGFSKESTYHGINVAARYGCLSAVTNFNVRSPDNIQYCENVGNYAEELARKDN